MDQYQLTRTAIAAFAEHLQREERSPGTVEKYLRDLGNLHRWLNGRQVSRECVAAWKESLCAAGYAPVTVNSMLAAAHSFFAFLGWTDCRVKYLRIQRKLFRDSSRTLNRSEYEQLLAAAQARGERRLALLMETICSTGIRVSEVRYITVETARQGRAEITLKGKIRTILLPARLCRKLLKFAEKNRVASGEIFRTGSGSGMGRRQIWAEIKRLCRAAGVKASKVFPHNLRHLFAAAYYRVYKDIARLADVLGHSSIETTRIYLLSTGTEQARQLDRLGLVS